MIETRHSKTLLRERLRTQRLRGDAFVLPFDHCNNRAAPVLFASLEAHLAIGICSSVTRGPSAPISW
jgi:hypothetical protein